MAWTLSNLQTEDTYTADLTLIGLDAVYVTLQVYNAAVLMQRQVNMGTLRSTSWEPEVLLPPGIYQMRRNLAGIRVKSAVAGLPALVTIEALAYGE